MIQLRKADDRGHADHGWLQARHTFSFADYQDSRFMGFRSLRVMNEDRIAAGKGFGMHPHRDMEIVTYVLSGQLQHQDSMGNGEVLRAGEFQQMSAGRGIMHSEFNPSPSEPTHLYQIWLYPSQRGIEPAYQQRRFDLTGDRLHLVASPDQSGQALTIHQDAHIHLSRLSASASVFHRLDRDRHGWLQILRGQVLLNDQALDTGDGAAISDEQELTITATTDAEVMLFDLA
ncbi:MAG: pirin family protein [Pirellulales bacterium]|nr:pirin family protein [Pirellulales bacterium]